MRKPDFCLCENKDADQHCTADQHICFCYTDSTIPIFLSFKPSSVDAQAGLCQTWSETPKTVFLMSQLRPKLKNCLFVLYLPSILDLGR